MLAMPVFLMYNTALVLILQAAFVPQPQVRKFGNIVFPDMTVPTSSCLPLANPCETV